MNKGAAGKRIQHCSLCKNHGLRELKKKHQCKFDKCLCDFCDLTRRCQTAMRHQQRLWRHQKNNLQKLYKSGQIKGQVCDKCRNHDLLVQKKDHACPYINCKCSHCNLNHVRKELMKYQQRVRRCNVTESLRFDPDSPQSPELKDDQQADNTDDQQEETSSPPMFEKPITPKLEPPSCNSPVYDSPPQPPLNDVPLWVSKPSPPLDQERSVSPIELTPSPPMDYSPEAHSMQTFSDNEDMSTNVPRMSTKPVSSPPPLIQLKWPPYSCLSPYLSPDMAQNFIARPPRINELHPNKREFDSFLNIHRQKGTEQAFRDPYYYNTSEDIEMLAVSPPNPMQDLSNKKINSYNQPLLSWDGFPKYGGYSEYSQIRNCDLNVSNSFFNTFNYLYFNKSKPSLHRPIPLIPRSPPKQPSVLNRNVTF